MIRDLFTMTPFLPRSTFSDFAHKYAKDERFRGVEKTRERESLFNEFIVEIRRKEKDERDAQREKVGPYSIHYHSFWYGRLRSRKTEFRLILIKKRPFTFILIHYFIIDHS